MFYLSIKNSYQFLFQPPATADSRKTGEMPCRADVKILHNGVHFVHYLRCEKVAINDAFIQIIPVSCRQMKI